MAKSYARFQDIRKALLCCDLAEKYLCDDKERKTHLEKIGKTRLEAYLFSGHSQEADLLLEKLSTTSDIADLLHLIRAEHALFRENNPAVAAIHLTKAKEKLKNLKLCILAQSEASLLAEQGETERALGLYQSSEREYRSLKPATIYLNPWHLIRYAETLLRAGKPGSRDLFLSALDLLNRSAEQGRDILTRASFMELNPGAYESLVENLLPLDASLAWKTAQQIKNYYLVIELSHENFTYKAWNLLQHEPGTPIPEKLKQEILHYDFKPVEWEGASLSEIQSTMPKDEMILDYFLSEKKCHLFQITADSFKVYGLEISASELSEASRKGATLLAACSDSTMSLELRDTKLQDEISAFAEEFGKALFPFPELTPKIFLIPHKFLNHMPFQILRHPLSRNPLGFDCELTLPYNVLTSRWKQDSQGMGLNLFLHDKSMPFAEREYRELSKQMEFQQIQSADELVKLAGKAQTVHFAGHFEFEEMISRSSFDLGEGNKITLKDLFPLRFEGADILLNACESGKNTIYGSETEYFDAARFFIRQGARQVLTSMNPIRNGTAFFFAKALYSHFPEKSLATALHQVLLGHPEFARFCPYIVRR